MTAGSPVIERMATRIERWVAAGDRRCIFLRCYKLQHLFLGINAPINYDLVLAVADLLGSEWHVLSPAQRHRRYEDHCGVNQIIAETVDTVQDRVLEQYAPMLDLVDKICGPFDEWMTARMIAAWRDDV